LALTVDVFPVPLSPSTYILQPWLSSPSPKSIARNARSWPMVSSNGLISSVVLNGNCFGSHVHRSSSGVNDCGFFGISPPVKFCQLILLTFSIYPLKFLHILPMSFPSAHILQSS